MLDSKKSFETVHAASQAVIRRQKRALVTRQQLVEAARVIFARDGFEHARLEDIAAAAEKSRGAFYANFKDKEDIFFAIFEEDIDRDRERIRPLLRCFKTIEERIVALSKYVSDLCKDGQRTLLHIEFKLYAIRHPSKRQRLADLHAAMRLRCSVPEIDELVPEIDQQSASERRTGSLAMGAVLEGLSFNRLFDPGAIDEETLTQYMSVLIRETLPLPIAE